MMRTTGPARAKLEMHAYCGMTVPIDDTSFRIDVATCGARRRAGSGPHAGGDRSSA